MSPVTEGADLLTIRGVAERLGVSRQRAQQLVRERGFPEPGTIVVTYDGWRPADVDAWAREHRPPAPAGATSPSE